MPLQLLFVNHIRYFAIMMKGRVDQTLSVLSTKNDKLRDGSLSKVKGKTRI